jgi:hypothetical protein
VLHAVPLQRLFREDMLLNGLHADTLTDTRLALCAEELAIGKREGRERLWDRGNELARLLIK